MGKKGHRGAKRGIKWLSKAVKNCQKQGMHSDRKEMHTDGTFLALQCRLYGDVQWCKQGEIVKP